MGKNKKTDKARKAAPAKTPAGKKGLPILPLVIAIAVAALVAGYLAMGGRGPQRAASAQDIESLKGGETRPTLSPTLFVGKTAAAYQIARDNPELLDAMYCYCYCEQSVGHKSLLSCYVDEHAANCGICQDQAFYASSIFKEGKDLAQVRQAVDRKFWKPLR